MSGLHALLTPRNQVVFDRGGPENQNRFERSFYEARCTRKSFEAYVANVKWRKGDVTIKGYGPTGSCLVSWIDNYPISAFLTSKDNFYTGVICGHCSTGGDQVAKVIANALFFAAENPDGRRGSDSHYLRCGGKAAFFDFRQATSKVGARSLLEMLANDAAELRATKID